MGEVSGPISEIGEWIRAVESNGEAGPTPMALCTVDEHGCPRVRTVPLRGIDESGLLLHTNMNSEKASDILRRPAAVAALISLSGLGREIRTQAKASVLSEEEADRSFGSRRRADQLWSWVVASPGPIADRDELTRRWVEASAKFAGRSVTRPTTWRVVRLEPWVVEFYRATQDRRHERRRFRRSGDSWTLELLVP